MGSMMIEMAPKITNYSCAYSLDRGIGRTIQYFKEVL